MDVSTDNLLDFAARVQRIEAMRASAQQLIHVGADEAYLMPRRDKRAVPSSGRVLLTNLMYPVSMVMAVAMGVAGHAAGQIARFHLQGMQDPGANPDVEMLVQIAVGLGLSMAFGYVLQLKGHTFTTLKSLGVVIGLLFFHNAVHLWPKVFAGLTSEIWVNQILSQTKPYSLMWRGITFLLG